MAKQKIRFEDRTESEIVCPNCVPVVKLIVRSNRTNDGQFLGCPNWPDCGQTRAIPQAWYMAVSGQPRLFEL